MWARGAGLSISEGRWLMKNPPPRYGTRARICFVRHVYNVRRLTGMSYTLQSGVPSTTHTGELMVALSACLG